MYLSIGAYICFGVSSIFSYSGLIVGFSRRGLGFLVYGCISVWFILFFFLLG